jgi:NAD(P)-dependent dehydrogenase (short-subunit alcohol dehydrogenase family)
MWISLSVILATKPRCTNHQLLERCHRIHVLLNSAGVWKAKRALTSDGINIETTFAVNHLGSFLLSSNFLSKDRLMESAPSGRMLEFDNLEGGDSTMLGPRTRTRNCLMLCCSRTEWPATSREVGSLSTVSNQAGSLQTWREKTTKHYRLEKKALGHPSAAVPRSLLGWNASLALTLQTVG